MQDSGQKNAESQGGGGGSVGFKPGVFECLKKSMDKKTIVSMSSEEYRGMMSHGRCFDIRLQNEWLTYRNVENAISSLRVHYPVSFS